MNYRHAYHAGNFADVMKHVILARVIAYLAQKQAPFRVVDTHAGRGRYTLTSPEAEKTGEWRGGVGKLLGPEAAPLPRSVRPLLEPYLAAVRAENAPGRIAVYPGSPLIAQRLLRPHDTLVANELHPEEWAALKAAMGRDRRVKLMSLDGWVALKSLLPPKERRGVVLIDPPYEQEGELDRLVDGLVQAFRRFATGVYLAWYPIKDEKPIARFHARLAGLDAPKLLRTELLIRAATDPERLNGCGLVVANPPYTLEGELNLLLPELAERLGAGPGAGSRIDWLSPANGRGGIAPAGRKGRMRIAT